MSTPEDDIAEGVAQILNDAGAGVWDNTGRSGNIFIATAPDAPDVLIVIYVYLVAAEPVEPRSKYAVHITYRGTADVRTVNAPAQLAFDALQNLTHTQMGDCNVIQSLLKTDNPMGQDDKKRLSRVVQFFLDVDVPPTTNRPAGGWD